MRSIAVNTARRHGATAASD